MPTVAGTVSPAPSLVADATLIGCPVCGDSTIEPEENYDLIQAFIARHPDFSFEPASQFVPEEVVTDGSYIETFPHRHSMDGSFAVRLRKAPA